MQSIDNWKWIWKISECAVRIMQAVMTLCRDSGSIIWFASCPQAFWCGPKDSSPLMGNQPNGSTVLANANAHHPMLRLDLTVTSGVTRGWMARGSPATHTFIREWNEPSCMHFISIHQMASPVQGCTHLDQLTTHLSTLKGLKAESA